MCGGPLEIEGSLPHPSYSLGEGDTPLIDGSEEGLQYKLEYLNPTGSFKDRGAALSVWLARRLGYSCVVEDSSGNTALAVTGIAGWFGLRARVHVPKTISSGKYRLLRFMGAEVVVHGTRWEAGEAAKRESGRCFYVAHSYSPVFIEGLKSLGHELAEEARGKRIVLPVSSGSLLLGVYRGLLEKGVEPDIVAVQSPEAPSLASVIKPIVWEGSTGRLLDALVVKNPPRLHQMGEAAKQLVVVGDNIVKEAWRGLASRGLIVEPSSASVLAAYKLLPRRPSILILTGSGLKYHDKMDV